MTDLGTQPSKTVAAAGVDSSREISRASRIFSAIFSALSSVVRWGEILVVVEDARGMIFVTISRLPLRRRRSGARRKLPSLGALGARSVRAREPPRAHQRSGALSVKERGKFVFSRVSLP
jgi:hypothetical protein